jgi:hypothetical protein
MVVSPIDKEPFLVDVKGLYRKNPWIIKRKTNRKSLFYILAYVPMDEPNQFFVMPQQRVLECIQNELTRLKRPSDYPMTGFSWKLALDYKDKWKLLPK